VAKRQRSRGRSAKTEEAAGASARPFWSGTITFGLVGIPVDLYPANRAARAGLRMIGPGGVPLRRRYYAENGKSALADDEIVRGYEYAKGKYVVVTDEELERLAPEKSRDIHLQRFVPEHEIDPLYFERGYFLAPSGNSSRAYQLLAQSMAKSGRAGIATFVMRNKEYLVAIVSENGILRAETLRFADELRPVKALGLPSKTKPAAGKVRSFERIIARSSKRQLSAKLLEDPQAPELLKLVKRKKSRNEDVVELETGAEDGADVIDLMAVLRKSLESPGSRGGKSKRAA
jgi:DNA end-binding protein Ku